MIRTRSIKAIEHDESEIDGLQQCLDYLSTYEDTPIPARSPRRQKMSNYKANIRFAKESHEAPEELMDDASSEEYNMGSDNSARSSIFSNNSNFTKKFSEFELDDMFLDEVDYADRICTIDNVVTIVRKHDRWDPKKVRFVSTR